MQVCLDNNIDQFSKEVESISGVNVYNCYQCGKCSAGCAVGSFLEDSPSRIIRYIQLNQKELVFNSKTPYLCASCQTCSTRCPMDIDVARIMESIRIAAMQENREPAVKDVTTFSNLFLTSVKMFGRLYELGLTAGFNLTSMQPFKDAPIGGKLFKYGRLALIPDSIKDKTQLKKIFDESDYFSSNNSNNVKEKGK